MNGEDIPAGAAAMPLIGALRWVAPSEPWKVASPNENTPPSDATSQYPLPVGVAVMPTMGAAPGPMATIRFIMARRRAASCGSAVSRTMARPITSPAQPPSACSNRATIRLCTSGATAAARPASA